MKTRRDVLTAALTGVIAGWSFDLFAHGDEKNAKKSGALKKEQKPWGIAGDRGL